MNSELISVVKERVDLGHSDESIKEELINAGYNENDVIRIIEVARHGGDVSAFANEESTMPRATELLKSSFSYIFKRYDLLLLLSAPLVFISLLEYLEISTNYEQEVIKIIFAFAAFFSIVGYYLLFISVFYIVSFSKDREIPFNEAIAWTFKNIWGFIFINVLTSLVVMGGFLLLIVPGIILSVYLYLSQFIFAIEGKRGMSALLRSRDLVRGNWSKVASRIVFVYLLIFLMFLLIGGFGSMLISLAPLGTGADFITSAFMQIVSAFVAMIGLCIGVEMYRWLAIHNQVSSFKAEKGKALFIALATIGFASAFLVIGSMGYLYSVHGEEYFKANYEKMLDLDTEEIDTSAKERALELRSGLSEEGEILD